MFYAKNFTNYCEKANIEPGPLSDSKKSTLPNDAIISATKTLAVV